MSEPKVPMRGQCDKCDHEWVVAWLPMSIDRIVPLLKAPCPHCGSYAVFVKTPPP